MRKCSHAKYELVSDERLMTGIQHGDTDAFNELYRRYYKRLLYYFGRMLGNSDEKARDFLQDIFIKIIERPDQYDPSRKFSTWLFSVAHNMCKNEYRRLNVRRNMIREENPDQYHVPHNVMSCDEQLTADQIFDAISNFEETEKTAFILYYREDFSLQEIAQVLEVPEGTIKSKLFYIRKKLSAKLQVYDN